MIRLVILCTCCAALLTGCWLWRSESDRTGTVVERREYQEEGVQAGQPFTKAGTETRTVESQEKQTEKNGVDPEAIQMAVKAAVSAATGDIRALISTIPKPLTGDQNIDTLLTAIVAYLGSKGGLTALAKYRERKSPPKA